MSQLMVSIEMMDKKQLIALLDFIGQADFIREMARIDAVRMTDEFVNHLTEILGEDGLRDLTRARNAFETGSPGPESPVQEGPDTREAFAQELKELGPWTGAYVRAVRGYVPTPARGIEILIAMLRDDRVPSKYKGKSPGCPLQIAFRDAFNAQAAQVMAEKQARQAEMVTQAEELELTMRAHYTRVNIAGMQGTLRRLKGAFLQGALIKIHGSAENRDLYIQGWQTSIDLMMLGLAEEE